jgi:hypothetical protein
MATAENEGTASRQWSHFGPAGQPPCGSGDEDLGPLLSAHATLVFLAAGFAGTVVGILTLYSTGNTAGALLACLTSMGLSATVLHKLIGR